MNCIGIQYSAASEVFFFKAINVHLSSNDILGRHNI